MKIIWSPLAVERLENIYKYIFKDNPVAAGNLIKRIIDKVESLSENPERGRNVPEANNPAVKEIFEGEYRIIYRIKSKKIIILSVRSFRQLLKGKDVQ